MSSLYRYNYIARWSRGRRWLNVVCCMAGWPRERDPDPNSLYLIFRKILDPDPNSLYISDLQGDHVDAARILVHHKAPVDEVTVDYLTALHVAAHCGQYSQYIYIFFCGLRPFSCIYVYRYCISIGSVVSGTLATVGSPFHDHDCESANHWNITSPVQIKIL